MISLPMKFEVSARSSQEQTYVFFFWMFLAIETLLAFGEKKGGEFK